MKVVVQRVQEANVTVEGELKASIGRGMLLLVGITPDDTQKDIDYLVRKITQLRIFDDEQGVMNLSILDKGFDILAVSQFTLLADTRKGNRPSYIKAARPEMASPFFDNFVQALEKTLGETVPTGIFGADMNVALINDGPVTILLDSLNGS
ncbi:D-tyrosyl-tRNA(Tyr) deacylase [Advenella sp. WQ 585]|uniref:D-aminoacyl-tRNA deacylase n=1 Tax=Advenella mandrilli TaxID=2800330 RepID=A0ABS1EHI0_9BURK|nr:D-aminoacyl-tRNA deacylase [Advenella mandrilli]MBK1782454.1 D-tyrosyl-tRNA(Tyr) deacylase [Advenella mandrilli]